MSKEENRSTRVAARAESAFLLGRFDYSLDKKNRFTIPAQWRQILGEPEYVFVMPDSSRKCLNIIPLAEMEARLAKLREKALFDPSLAQALHTIGANSEQVALDVQGRIRVSDRLLKFAGVKDGVTLIGAVRKIEIWRPTGGGKKEAIDQAALGAALEEAGF